MSKTLSESLLALAVHLTDKAGIELAASQDHLRNGEKELARIRARRHDNALFYVGVCREAAAKLTAKAKRAGFVPPGIEAVKNFAINSGMVDWPLKDLEKWFNHFESNGWRVGGKATMADWKAAARNGYARWKEENPKAAPGVKAQPDPFGWRDFLTSHHYPYCAHWSADSGRRQEFSRWKGGK